MDASLTRLWNRAPGGPLKQTPTFNKARAMTRPTQTPEPAGPTTQTAERARGGGTYDQGDFTTAAQRSKLETDHLDQSPATPGAAGVADAAREGGMKPKP